MEIQAQRPDWQLFRDGCPGGEMPAQVGARADRVVSRVRADTMPEGTLKAFADHGEVAAPMAADGGDCEAVLAQFAKAGIGVDALAAKLQKEGADSFVKSWNELMGVIASKSAVLEKTA